MGVSIDFWVNMSVLKKIAILLFSSFVGIIANPEMPFASDTVAINDIDRSFETVVEVEAGDALSRGASETPVATGVSALALGLPASGVPSKEVSQPRQTALANRIDIAGRSLEVVNVANTSVDVGNHVNKYGEKFLYGHNLANVFGALYNVNEGDTFSVTLGGVTKNYLVQAKVIYEKVGPTTLNLNGLEVEMNVLTRARYSGVATYDMALMTCYGTMYGNGDASHRLVLFANAI